MVKCLSIFLLIFVIFSFIGCDPSGSDLTGSDLTGSDLTGGRDGIYGTWQYNYGSARYMIAFYENDTFEWMIYRDDVLNNTMSGTFICTDTSYIILIYSDTSWTIPYCVSGNYLLFGEDQYYGDPSGNKPTCSDEIYGTWESSFGSDSFVFTFYENNTAEYSLILDGVIDEFGSGPFTTYPDNTFSISGENAGPYCVQGNYFLCEKMLFMGPAPSGSFEIYGTWKCIIESQTIFLELNEDLTFTQTVYDLGVPPEPPTSGTFTYTDNSITFDYSDDPETPFALYYALDSTTLILAGYYYFPLAYIRQ